MLQNNAAKICIFRWERAKQAELSLPGYLWPYLTLSSVSSPTVENNKMPVFPNQSTLDPVWLLMWAGNSYLSALDVLFYGLCFVELTPINYQISISRNLNNHIKKCKHSHYHSFIISSGLLGTQADCFTELLTWHYSAIRTLFIMNSDI